MKIFVFVLCFFLSSLAVHPKAIMEERNLSTEKARTSYALGMAIGEDFKQTGFEIDYTAFVEGLRAEMEGLETKMDQEEAIEIIRTAFDRLMERQTAELQAAELVFLEENAARPGISVTESGLQYEMLITGTGQKPGPADIVLVHYEGSLVNGDVFDSSYMRDDPEEIPLDMVIQGWAEGIQLMHTGGKIRLFIPSDLAYGEYGAGQAIPPFSTLIFTIELFDIIEYDAEED